MKRVAVFFYLVSFSLSSLFPDPCIAQTASDTITLSLTQLEDQFLTRNFQLLAQRYQIDAAQADIIQASLRPNPNFWLQTNLYNPNTGKFFPLSTPSTTDLDNQVFNSGYVALQLQQVIQLAGQRSKLIALSESNRALASITFRDVLRTLRYQLYTTYANLYYDLQALALLKEEEQRQGRLIESSRIALRTGGIAPYELTRLEVALRDLRASMATYRSQIVEEQGILRVLLRQQGTTFIQPVAISIIRSAIPSLSIAIDSALTNRPDAALTREQITNAERRVVLERARRTPDLTAGVLYERYGNTYVNFTGLQLAMDLPVFNRNQGAIKLAQLTAKNAQAALANQQSVVQSEVLEAHQKLDLYYEQQTTIPDDYLSRVQTISMEATRTYNARIIGLLDYLDKVRTYQSAQLNYLTLQNNIFQAQQQLNYTTNTRFF